jgi:hydrogenase maturation protease
VFLITVLGAGNLLLGDDGAGPRVIEELSKYPLPGNVTVTEAGRSFIQHWDAFQRSKHVIIVDTVQGGGPPGTIYILSRREITRSAGCGTLGHEDDLPGVIDLLARFNIKPEVTIVGIEPGEIKFSLELSPAISARLPCLTKTVYKLCLRLSLAAAGDASNPSKTQEAGIDKPVLI